MKSITCDHCGARLDPETCVQIGAQYYCTVECHRAKRHAQDEEKREEKAQCSKD